MIIFSDWVIVFGYRFGVAVLLDVVLGMSYLCGTCFLFRFSGGGISPPTVFIYIRVHVCRRLGVVAIFFGAVRQLSH